MEGIGVPVGVPIWLRSNEFRVRQRLHPWVALVRPTVTIAKFGAMLAGTLLAAV